MDYRLRLSNVLISGVSIAMLLIYGRCVSQPKLLSPERVEVDMPVASPTIKAPVASGNSIGVRVQGQGASSQPSSTNQPASTSQPAVTAQTGGDRSVQASANQPQSAQTNQAGGVIQYSRTQQGLGTGGIVAIVAGLVVVAYLKRSCRDEQSIERKILRGARD